MKKPHQSDLIVPGLILFLGLVLIGLMTRTVALGGLQDAKVLTELNGKVYTGYLAADIEKGITITNAVEQAVVASGGKLTVFSDIAESMMTEYVQSIQIAPGGVVTEIYPAKGNEAGLMDLIHRKDARGVTSRYARDHDVIIMQGPFDLAQGGRGIAIRNPIFLKKNGAREFWGFSIVIIRVPEVFAASVASLAEFGYDCRLLKQASPVDASFSEVYRTAALPQDPLAFEFEAGDSRWRLEIAPAAGWFDYASVAKKVIPSLVCLLLLSLVVFFVIRHRRLVNEGARERMVRDMAAMANEQQLRRQVQLYASAMGVEYPLAIDLDYLGNRYQMIEYDNFLNKTAARSGSIDELIRVGASTIPDEKEARIFFDAFRREAAVAAFRRGEKEITVRHRQNGDDGRIHWIESKTVCIECSDRVVHGLALSKCIDDEMENKRLRVEAEKANRAKSSFLLRMSHDIRTPLNGILGMIEIAEQNADDKEKQAACRDKARDAARVLLELVNEVLDMGKLESGELVFEHVPFDLRETVRSSCDVIRRQAESRGIEVIEDFDLPVTRLVGSPVHLKRVLMNVLANAVKYNKENGKIWCSLRVTPADETHVRLEFTCRDTGVGMTKEFQARLFEPFTQEDLSVRSQYGGSGLGMAIAKSIVDKMGGAIRVESVKGEGTTFDIVLPVEIDRRASDKAPEADAAPASIQGFRILLVEDNDLNLEIARYLLEEAGAEIVDARNGREAVAAFEKSAPFTFDVVLMDIMMPEMDGHEATRRIRAMNRPDAALVPVIAMTANAFTEDRLAAKAAGMNEHLAKPLEAQRVIRTIARCVAESRAARKLPRA